MPEPIWQGRSCFPSFLTPRRSGNRAVSSLLLPLPLIFLTSLTRTPTSHCFSVIGSRQKRRMDLGPSRKGSDIEARQPAWAFAVNCPNTFDESAFLRRLRDVQPKTESTAPNLELQAKTISKDEYGELRRCLFVFYWRAYPLHRKRSILLFHGYERTSKSF